MLLKSDFFQSGYDDSADELRPVVRALRVFPGLDRQRGGLRSGILLGELDGLPNHVDARMKQDLDRLVGLCLACRPGQIAGLLQRLDGRGGGRRVFVRAVGRDMEICGRRVRDGQTTERRAKTGVS